MVRDPPYGVEGLRHHVREHVRLAQDFAARVKADDRLELVGTPPLNLVCFRHAEGEEATQRLLDRLNDSGRLYLTHTRLDDTLTLRFAVGQTWTQQRHVDEAWALIQDTTSAG